MEVGRPLEVPMPKFYTAEGRKALVLRKGFSSPTRDDVSTALGAWAITAAALVRDAVRGRSQALDRSLRTPPKRPTRAKE